MVRKTKTRSFVSAKTSFTKLTNSTDLDFGILHPLPPFPVYAVSQNK